MAANRDIVVRLDSGEYERLRQRALAEDRDAHQQARWIIRSALKGAPLPEQERREVDAIRS